MTTPTATLAPHLDDELLSAYLDGELPSREAATVEHHLEQCSGCRTRLDGLRRVVGVLARLERAAPPPVLAGQVKRRVALEGRRTGLLERLEGDLRGLRLDSPMVVTFAVVLALAVIVFLFSHGLANRGGEVAFQVAPPEAVEGLMAELEAVEIEGRELVRDGGLWRQDGLPDGAARTAAAVAWDSPEGRALRRDHPWIEELLSLTGAGSLLFAGDDGEPVLISRPGTAGGAASGAEALPEDPLQDDGALDTVSAEPAR